MPTQRSSRRLKSKEPASPVADRKRVSKPSKRALEASLPPQTSKRPPKKRARRAKVPTPIISPSPPSSPAKAPEKESIDISSSLPSTPLVRRTKATPAQKLVPPFDPTKEIPDHPHYVSITAIPIIDGSEKDAVLLSLNINDVFRQTFTDMKSKVYMARIQPWEERRGLVGAYKCLAQPWVFYIGSLRGNYEKIGVSYEAEFDLILMKLRQQDRGGEKKWCFQMKAEVPYNTLDRAHTPPPTTKATNKSQPRKVQTLGISRSQELVSSPITINDEEDEDEEEPFSNNGTNHTLLKIQNSVTKRQLQKKKGKDEALNSSEKMRRRIFGFHQCVEDRCGNYRACCFKLKSTGCHHKVSILEQEEWAENIIGGVGKVSLEKPPQSFLIAYAGGHGKQQFKSSKAKKIEASTPPTTQESSSNYKPIEIHNHYPPQAQAMPQAALPPGWSFDANIVGPNMSVSRPNLPRSSSSFVQADGPLASSPLRHANLMDIDLLLEYENHLVASEVAPPRIAAIRAAIQGLRDDFIDLNQLCDELTQESLVSGGMPWGIAIIVKKGASAFRKDQKARQQLSTAQTLFNLSTSGTS